MKREELLAANLDMLTGIAPAGRTTLDERVACCWKKP